MSSQSLAQHSVKDVSARVVSRYPASSLCIHQCVDFIVNAELADFDLELMNDDATNRSICADYPSCAIRSSDRSAVAHLAAGLRIEWRLVKNDFRRRSPAFD